MSINLNMMVLYHAELTKAKYVYKPKHDGSIAYKYVHVFYDSLKCEEKKKMRRKAETFKI